MSYKNPSLKNKVAIPIESGIETITLEGTTLRGIYPYKASSNFMGRNCKRVHALGKEIVLLEGFR